MSETRVQSCQDQVGAEPVDSSGLAVHRLSFLEAVAMIVGTNIGAGVLSMAYASRKAGFMPLLLWLAVAGVFTTISMLYVSETALRTRTHNQLSGLAQRYVGSFGAWAIFLSVAVNSIGALIAYMSGSGKILSAFLGISPALGSLLFFLPAALVLYLGLGAIGKGEKFISIGMVSMIVLLVVATLVNENTDVARLLEGDWIYMVPVFNIAVFCFSAQYIVPEMARGFSHAPSQLPKAVITGMLVTFCLLAIVPMSVISLTGLENQTEVATLAWGQALGQWAFYTANTFALCAMLTSYWGLGGSFLTNIFDKFHKLGPENQPKTRLLVLGIVCVPPFLLAYSGMVGFVNALYFAGAFSGVILSIMPILMLRSARRRGDLQPAWQCGWIAHPLIQVFIVMIYLASAAYALCSALNLLPSGW
ncbi:amino acid permease [Metapseudomonas lalkuanensis]|uniref:aromatic amino acid transport family protein n=1 Tax=Metapseudomonas lalkuanensis TaxID=2604832 RepID=UPI001CF2512C|nr:amino acid permease [Pseudomonas lalkuanensis]UCO99284.1 amino acid permease [Pseudomonas lalkuanensis]